MDLILLILRWRAKLMLPCQCYQVSLFSNQNLLSWITKHSKMHLQHQRDKTSASKSRHPKTFSKRTSSRKRTSPTFLEEVTRNSRRHSLLWEPFHHLLISSSRMGYPMTSWTPSFWCTKHIVIEWSMPSYVQTFQTYKYILITFGLKSLNISYVCWRQTSSLESSKLAIISFMRWVSYQGICSLIQVFSSLGQALEVVLLPNNCEDISDHVVSTLEVMADNFPLWVNFALRCLPSVLVNSKHRGKISCSFVSGHNDVYFTPSAALDEFVKSIRRHLSLIPLIRSCTLILSQTSTVRRMIFDLKKIDFTGMNEDIHVIIDNDSLNEIKGILAFFLKESQSEISENSMTSSTATKSMGISMTNLAAYIKESMNRVVRNTVSEVMYSYSLSCQQLWW